MVEREKKGPHRAEMETVKGRIALLMETMRYHYGVKFVKSR